MPTPHFSFRLPTEEAASLREMAKLYGARDTSSFLREMVGAMCSGDRAKVATFVGRLMQKVGEQLTLQLTSSVEAIAEPQKPAKKVVKAKAKKKGGGRAGKRP